MKISTILSGKLRRATVVALALAISVVAVTAGMGGHASAAGCRFSDATLRYPAGGGGVLATDQYVVPSWSTCNDINITTITSYDRTLPYCMYLHVRFFPSSGPSYTNSWNYMCSSSILKPLASNVANGTRYQIEGQANNIIIRVGVYD